MTRPVTVVLRFVALLVAAPVASAAAQQAPPPPVEALAAAARGAVTQEGLRRHAQAIVQHQRPSGSPGENAAIDHIVGSLRAEGVAVEVFTFPAFTSDPVSARVEVLGSDFAPEAITASFSGVARALEAPLVDVGSLRDLPDPEAGTGELIRLPEGAADGLPEVRGVVALVTGQPRNIPTAVLQSLGAVGVIFVNPEERLNDLIVTSTWGIPSLRSAHRVDVVPVAQVKRGAGERLREMLRAGPVRVRLSTEVATGWKPLRLAVATIPAPDADAPFVLLGGHIDAWYHGGTDEGASNAAMVELARAFHHNRDRLRRGLVVAWWPGHSNARYAGSTWYADHFFEELRDRGVAYLNIDGVGQRKAKRFGANATASLGGLAASVVQAREGESIRPTRPGRNSDQSFNGVGLPLLQLNHTRLEEDGGYWWWHTPDDTFDKIDFGVLERDTELYVDALAALLASPRLPVSLGEEVAELGRLLEERQRLAGDRFDLAEAVQRQGRLLDAVAAAEAAVAGSHGVRIDLQRLRVLRPVHRVLYSPFDPFSPDPGVETDLLPGLAPLRILNEAPPESDRYRFAETSLVRERNRILEALADALREAEALRSMGGTE